MSYIVSTQPEGVIRSGWSAEMDDYAIACDWANSGDLLIVCDVSGGIKAFDSKSGKPIWEHSETHKGGLLAMAVHPDGSLVATSGQDGFLLIWDTVKGAKTKIINLGQGWIEHLAWSIDGQMLAAACSRKVYVLDTEGEEKWSSDNHPSTVSSVAWSYSNELATACYGRVTFYDLWNQEKKQKLEWRGSMVSMVLSPDGDVVACGSQDNSVHFWRRSTSQDSMMSGYPGKPANLVFDHEGKLLATGGAEIITVWSFKDGGPEGTRPGQLKFHQKPISSLVFVSRGNRLASGARDGSVAIWALQSDGEGERIGSVWMTDQISDLAWRPDGRALAGVDAQGQVTAWRIRK